MSTWMIESLACTLLCHATTLLPSSEDLVVCWSTQLRMLLIWLVFYSKCLWVSYLTGRNSIIPWTNKHDCFNWKLVVKLLWRVSVIWDCKHFDPTSVFVAHHVMGRIQFISQFIVKCLILFIKADFSIYCIFCHSGNPFWTQTGDAVVYK